MTAAAPAGREDDPVELVDTTGHPVGEASVADAHTAPGQLHRAFSVLLLSADGDRLLLQRRAAGKTRFPRRWANSCCGHPPPGEPVLTAAGRRLVAELGVAGVPLREIGVYQYRADDPDSGRVEHEYDHIVVGRVVEGQPLYPDPAEVSEVWWAGPRELDQLLTDRPRECAPWLAGVVGPLARAAGEQWRR